MANQDEEGNEKEDPKTKDSSVEESVEGASEEAPTASGEDGAKAQKCGVLENRVFELDGSKKMIPARGPQTVIYLQLGTRILHRCPGYRGCAGATWGY